MLETGCSLHSESSLAEAFLQRCVRRELILSVAFSCLTVLLSGTGWGADATELRPSVVIIVADDLGYADLGCKEDRGESHNLASQHPEKVAELSRMWEMQWQQTCELAARDE
jgi:hypothetical protein